MLKGFFDPQIGAFHVLQLRGQSGSGSNDNEVLLHIPQSSSIPGV